MAYISLDFLHNYSTGERRESDPEAYQYDEGHVLEAVVPVAVTSCEIQYWIRGMEKADAYTPTSITQNTDNTYTILGNIPNSYFETNGDLRVYIVVTDGDASITTYEGYIHIKERQMPEDYVDDDPENEAVRVIAEARAAAATATEKAGEAAASAEQAQEILDSIPADYTQMSEDVDTLKADTSTLKDDKADIDGYYQDMAVGDAEQLISTVYTEDSVPYNFRKTAGDGDRAHVDAVVGGTVCLNQLSGNNLQPGRTTLNGLTFDVSSDGTIIVNGTATANTVFNAGTFVAGHAGHKRYIHGAPSGGDSSTFWLKDGYGAVRDYGSGALDTVNNDRALAQIGIASGYTATNLKYVPQLTDITQAFGTAIADYVYSLEQSTAGEGVAWLKEHFPKIFNSGYIPYNPGEMVSVAGVSEKRNTGFNQWDEEYVNGFFNDSGVYTARADIVGSKNAIRVLPNTVYCFKGKASAFVTYWRSEVSIDNAPTKEFISRVQMNADVSTFTTPADCHYIFFNMSTAYGATYNHDICINLSDPARNGEYEPYEEHTYPLDPSADLRGFFKLDASNKLYADGDIYPPSGQVQHRYGDVTYSGASSEIWSKVGNYGSVTRFDSMALHGKPGTNLISNMFSVGPAGTADTELIALHGGTGHLIVQILTSKLSSDDIAGLMGYLVQHPLEVVYELATPTTEQATPYQQKQICDPNGTEEFISTTVAPIGHVTKYPENLRKKIEELPWNFATLIAPTEATFTATRNYTTGSLFIVNNVLYKATANIANGATIAPNSNCSATTLAEVISALS